MTDQSNQGGGSSGLGNGDPIASTSGLDPQGQFRIGEKITLAVRGDKIMLRQAHSGREVEVEEGEIQDLLNDKYFVAHSED